MCLGSDLDHKSNILPSFNNNPNHPNHPNHPNNRAQQPLGDAARVAISEGIYYNTKLSSSSLSSSSSSSSPGSLSSTSSSSSSYSPIPHNGHTEESSEPSPAADTTGGIVSPGGGEGSENGNSIVLVPRPGKRLIKIRVIRVIRAIRVIRVIYVVYHDVLLSPWWISHRICALGL